MFNSSMFGDNTSPDTNSLKPTSEDDTGSTHTTPGSNISVTTNNPDPRNTQNLRCYLEKECFPETEWSNDLIFNASTDKITYKDMDITKYVGESKFKDKEGLGSYRIYFNPKDYSVKQEMETMANLSEDTLIK